MAKVIFVTDTGVPFYDNGKYADVGNGRWGIRDGKVWMKNREGTFLLPASSDIQLRYQQYLNTLITDSQRDLP